MRKRFNLILLLLATCWGSLPLAAGAQTPEDAEQARQAAVAANAGTLAAESLADGEAAMSKARRHDENNKPEKAAAKFAEATQLFRDAELEAIQNRILATAREELVTARKVRAKKYAPDSLARAEQLANEALALLERDRSAVEQAATLAENAAATARLAQQISALAKKKPSVETLVLDHARALWQLQSAADLPQQADQDKAAATTGLAEEIIRLREAEQQLSSDLNDNLQYAAALEEEIRILDEQLGGASAERRQLVMRLEEQAREREQFEQAKQIFEAEEAEVFEQSGIIIARLTGLNFGSGSAELGADADVLFTKIRRLVNIFPGALISVEGHTDSRGGDRLNLKLSENRAQAVMNRIISDAALPPERISATGYGETRPIANNETEAGRAQNRRIDLLITPAVN